LIEVGGIDTVYRDVYLDRARTVLDPMLPPEDFHRLEQERAALAELVEPNVANVANRNAAAFA
jgi:hypothetical protein